MILEVELSQSRRTSFFHGKVSNATPANPDIVKTARIHIRVTGLGVVVAVSLMSTGKFTSVTRVGSHLIGRGRRVRVRDITERTGRHPGVSRLMIGMRMRMMARMLGMADMADMGGTPITAAGIACPACKRSRR